MGFLKVSCVGILLLLIVIVALLETIYITVSGPETNGAAGESAATDKTSVVRHSEEVEESGHIEIEDAVLAQGLYVLSVADVEEEDQYRESILRHASGLAEALDSLEIALQEYGQTDEWVTDIASCIMGVYRYTNEVQFIEAPEKYEKPHRLYAQGVKKYRDAMRQLIQAVNTEDEAAVAMFNRLLLEGAEMIQKAADELGQGKSV